MFEHFLWYLKWESLRDAAWTSRKAGKTLSNFVCKFAKLYLYCNFQTVLRSSFRACSHYHQPPIYFIREKNGRQKKNSWHLKRQMLESKFSGASRYTLREKKETFMHIMALTSNAILGSMYLKTVNLVFCSGITFLGGLLPVENLILVMFNL